MGNNPFEHSLRAYSPLTKESIAKSSPRLDTTVTFNRPTPPATKSLADTFKNISVELTRSKKDCTSTNITEGVCNSTKNTLITAGTTTTTTPVLETPDQQLRYNAIDFGTPPDAYYDDSIPDTETLYPEDWDF